MSCHVDAPPQREHLVTDSTVLADASCSRHRLTSLPRVKQTTRIWHTRRVFIQNLKGVHTRSFKLNYVWLRGTLKAECVCLWSLMVCSLARQDYRGDFRRMPEAAWQQLYSSFAPTAKQASLRDEESAWSQCLELPSTSFDKMFERSERLLDQPVLSALVVLVVFLRFTPEAQTQTSCDRVCLSVLSRSKSCSFLSHSSPKQELWFCTWSGKTGSRSGPASGKSGWDQSYQKGMSCHVDAPPQREHVVTDSTVLADASCSRHRLTPLPRAKQTTRIWHTRRVFIQNLKGVHTRSFKWNYVWLRGTLKAECICLWSLMVWFTRAAGLPRRLPTNAWGCLATALQQLCPSIQAG